MLILKIDISNNVSSLILTLLLSLFNTGPNIVVLLCQWEDPLDYIAVEPAY
jgi:hypothetical protein